MGNLLDEAIQELRSSLLKSGYVSEKVLKEFPARYEILPCCLVPRPAPSHAADSYESDVSFYLGRENNMEDLSASY